MTKQITKNIHDKLDSFVVGKKQDIMVEESNIQEVNTKTVRKQDGLIEKIGGKTLITEDNRQLLND
jgi:hypothetical protein